MKATDYGLQIKLARTQNLLACHCLLKRWEENLEFQIIILQKDERVVAYFVHLLV